MIIHYRRIVGLFCRSEIDVGCYSVCWRDEIVMVIRKKFY